jgi:hypothetical protein
MSTDIKDVLPGAAAEVEKAKAEEAKAEEAKLAFRSFTKLPRKGIFRPLVVKAVERGIALAEKGKDTEKALFGLTATEKDVARRLLAEHAEWKADPKAYFAKYDEPAQAKG